MIKDAKLFRVDINLKYLYITKDKEIGLPQVEKWLRTECHSGELDYEEDNVVISEVKNQAEIKDFDDDYNCYYSEDFKGNTY